MPDAPTDEPIPLADAEVAARVARAARQGRSADRAPTLEQLLLAFGEREPTPQARRRAAAALRVAGVRVTPGVEEAQPGQRLRLAPGPGVRPRGAGMRRALTGIALLVLVIAAGLTAATRTGRERDPPQRRSEATPAGPAPTATATPTPTATPTATPTRTASRRSRRARKRSAGARERSASAPKRSATARKRSAAARRRPRMVTVRLIPAQPTALCVDDGAGRRLYEGLFTTPLTFRRRALRLNVGRADAQVLVDGKRYALLASPDGVLITPRRQVHLPLGQRPCA